VLDWDRKSGGLGQIGGSAMWAEERGERSGQHYCTHKHTQGHHQDKTKRNNTKQNKTKHKQHTQRQNKAKPNDKHTTNKTGHTDVKNSTSH
jgi:hypothetical protein